jgi:SAM-dependent methyltransferase
VIPRTYKPAHSENRMRNEGDVVSARLDFAQRKSGNLRELLRSRYEWMNEFIEPESYGLDVGCGAGFSREFIRCRKLWLTDFTQDDHLDIKGVDALNLPIANASLDFVVASNMIHHVPRPVGFLAEAHRVLRPGGVLLLQEPQASFLFCAVLRVMRHEGYSFEVDVFDKNCICTDPDDLWAGNNAIPRLLFDDHGKFLRHQPEWSILRDEPCECLMFLNSGGVTAKTAYVPLPQFMLRGVELFDNVVAKLAPDLLALGRRIALRKI